MMFHGTSLDIEEFYTGKKRVQSMSALIRSLLEHLLGTAKNERFVNW
jgi:hypothetical protein